MPSETDFIDASGCPVERPEERERVHRYPGRIEIVIRFQLSAFSYELSDLTRELLVKNTNKGGTFEFELKRNKANSFRAKKQSGSGLSAEKATATYKRK